MLGKKKKINSNKFATNKQHKQINSTKKIHMNFFKNPINKSTKN